MIISSCSPPVAAPPCPSPPLLCATHTAQTITFNLSAHLISIDLRNIYYWPETVYALVHRGASLSPRTNDTIPFSSFVFACQRFLSGFTSLLHSAARYGHAHTAVCISLLHKILAGEECLSWVNAVDEYAACALAFSHSLHAVIFF
jgi:hypothetical protein